MKFTKYFAGTIRENGIPHIDVNQYKRLFNIITLESRLDELYSLKDKERSHDRKYNLEIRIFTLKEKLSRLTQDNEPKNILKHMVNHSDESNNSYF